MAMTKAERQELENALTEAAMARALRFPTDANPKPMTRDEINQASTHDGRASWGGASKVARGWFYNAYAMRVTYGCSNGINHSTEGNQTSTQSCGRMYRTKVEALRAMRHEKVREVASQLAAIDKQIEDEETKAVADVDGSDA